MTGGETAKGCCGGALLFLFPLLSRSSGRVLLPPLADAWSRFSSLRASVCSHGVMMCEQQLSFPEEATALSFVFTQATEGPARLLRRPLLEVERVDDHYPDQGVLYI